MRQFTILQNSIKINTILNVAKQCSAVLFPLITYPYISRTLGADNFGRISFSTSIVEYGMAFAALGIPTYMVREGAKIRDSKLEITKIATEIFTISVITMIISISLIGIFSFTVKRLSTETLIIGILNLNIVFYILGREWINTIYEDYLYITVRYIFFKIISLFLIFIFVKKPEHIIIYAIITVFSESGGYIINLFYTSKYVRLSLTLHPNIGKHLKSLILLFCSTIAVRIYIQSDITILGFLRTDSEVGIYSLSSKIYSVVKSILNAFIFVAIPRISYYIGNEDKDGYYKLLTKLKEIIFLLSFPCIIGMLGLSKNILFIMGGKDYEQGYVAFDILCISLLFAVLGCYYAQGILIPNRQEGKYFLSTLISAAVNILLNLIAIKYLGMEGAAITTLVAEIMITINCRRFSQGFYKNLTNDSFFPLIAGCLAIYGICRFFQYLNLGIIRETLISVVVSVAAYFSILYFGKNRIIRENIDSFLSRIL